MIFHRVIINLFVTLGAAAFAVAFVPTAIVPKVRRIQSFAVTAEPETETAPIAKAEVFPGVKLPEDEEVPPRLENTHTNDLVGDYIVNAAPKIFGSTLGRLKSDGLQAAQNLFIDSTLDHFDGEVPDQKDYKFFGNSKHSENLTYLLKTNPFFAFALTERAEGGFEIMSFDPTDPENKNDDAPLYRKLVSTLSGPGRRVNFLFDESMKITGFEVYDDITGQRIMDDEDKQEERACAVIYNILWYASNVHATIHVLHYLMTSAFQVASEDYADMNQWAETYASNIVHKIDQVANVLCTGPDVPTSFLTGVMGMGGSQENRVLDKEVLDMWGQNPTAKGFVECMMNISPEKMESANILTEFNKHCELIKPFATDTANALREIDQDKYTVADHRLKDYLKKCGTFKSEINCLEQWIELMSVTGVMHGGTLSMNRLHADPDIMRYINRNAKHWDLADVNVIVGGLGSVIGMEDGRRVMSSTTNADYAPKLQAVLDEYDETSSALKEAYKAKIMDERDVFNNYGWILSDFCPDGFDGKQLTMTTYI